MNEERVSARAAIGGYLPQFDELAWFVYLNLINNKLEWIRVADPKAEKLDNTPYSTYAELHAYQVKCLRQYPKRYVQSLRRTTEKVYEDLFSFDPAIGKLLGNWLSWFWASSCM